MAFFKFIADWGNNNPGKATGAILGFIFSFLLVILGVVKTIIIVIVVLLGLLIGKSLDDDRSIIDTIIGLFKRKDE